MRWDVNIAGCGWQLTIEREGTKRGFELRIGGVAGGGGHPWCWPPLATGSSRPLLGHSLDRVAGLQRGLTTAERPCKGSEKPSRAKQGECCPGSPSDRAYDDQMISLQKCKTARILRFCPLRGKFGRLLGVSGSVLGLPTYYLSLLMVQKGLKGFFKSGSAAEVLFWRQ